MSSCENKIAAAHAFPSGSMPVADRRMTLTIQCHETVEYTSSLRGVGSSRSREHGIVRSFGLCENHTRLYEQIDKELIHDEAWAPSHAGAPVRL